jgi:hypothetical protein
MTLQSASGAREARSFGLMVLAWIEIVVLGVVGLFLANLAIPQSLGVETWCFLDGNETATAMSYDHWIGIVAGVSWIVLVAGVIGLQVARRVALGLVLPIAWLSGLCLLAAVVAASIGEQPCSGSDIGALF